MKAKARSIPAPVGGLNARDAIADMDEKDAVQMGDLFPLANGVMLRRGETSFATFTGNCRTVIPYNGDELFIAVDTTNDLIIDATSGGAISTAVVGGSGPTVQSITSTFFDYAMMGNTTAQFISLVNGADTPLQYNGTTWAASSMSGTGLTVTDLHTVVEYAERLWFAGAGFDIWYLAADAIAGTATRLNLGSLFPRGGRINNMMTMSTDSSSQLADFIAFVSTEGEIVVFTGTDPASADTWARVAHLQVGRPVIRGNRCWCKFGADAVLITTSGLLSLRNAMQLRSDDDRIYLSDKIKKLFNADAVDLKSNFAVDSDDTWQVIHYPEGQKLIVNTAAHPSDLVTKQYVMNTETGAWTLFSTQMRNLAVLGGELYGGSYGEQVLYKVDVEDTVTTETAYCLQAYNYLGSRGAKKYPTMMKPIMSLTDIDTVKLAMIPDFEYGTTPTVVPTASYQATIQDPSTGIYNQWRGVHGDGFAIAPAVLITANNATAEAIWYSTDILYEQGPPL